MEYINITKDQRIELLRQEFASKQIFFREDSKLCKRFVNTGKTGTKYRHPNQIAKRMAEMRYLNTHTEYQDLLVKYEECLCNKSKTQLYKTLDMIELVAMNGKPYPKKWPWYKKPKYEDEYPSL
jgi:hypothetical protein